jgi:hypothetical protein
MSLDKLSSRRSFGWRAMTVIEMSERELTRLRVPNDLLDRRLTVEAAARFMGVGRRQVFGSRVAVACAIR